MRVPGQNGLTKKIKVPARICISSRHHDSTQSASDSKIFHSACFLTSHIYRMTTDRPIPDILRMCWVYIVISKTISVQSYKYYMMYTISELYAYRMGCKGRSPELPEVLDRSVFLPYPGKFTLILQNREGISYQRGH